MHYIKLEENIIKLTRPKQAIRDPLFNIFSLGSYVMGSFNNIFIETPKKNLNNIVLQVFL